MIELVNALGHANVRSKHETTLEVTKETHLTPQGDCIIAVGADKGMLELSEEFKEALRNGKAVLNVVIECNGVRDIVAARGSMQLTLTHPTDMVVRKSDYICPRTLAIKADKSARDLKKELVRELKKPDAAVKVTLELK